ncbi:glycoside hydrolase family 2 TIM barrel-domain containing protein [Desertivirga arenae]|uniref:glycoside hydrolase family 2 TIM barrel-domain containing protein n=1 Tax=Desertivirga arenae TaxID=2810309 RepID=UPI001A97BE91|nr:glycoside hydrolase family 2 TIM barrel-domain containing protein [Pedobacter sp. SYSU D00823]
MMKFYGLLLSAVINFSLQSLAQVKATVDSAGEATVPAEIENPQILGINKSLAHATLMPYANLEEALNGNRRASSYAKSLNGKWKFNWVSWPQKRPEDFYKPAFDVSAWKDIEVPSNWQIKGYGTPFYRNIGYTFQKDFPRVMSTPPENYTAYKERNPVGSYRRTFTVPASWKGGRTFITFDGVDAGFFLWINGKKVGYSVNSRNAAEFDISSYLRPGENVIAVEVYQYTSGSYLEDQDMWRLSGIFRNVTLWRAPETHIRDFFIKTDLDENYKNGTTLISTKVINYSSKRISGKKLLATIYKGQDVIKSAEAQVPELGKGQEREVNLSIPVTNPDKWTAETPSLYTCVLQLVDKNGVSEILSQKIGYREIEIKGRVFMVNGVPIKLKGVNRHENWPEVGHAITEAQMIRDIEVIKQGNCNHVRTSHYSDDPRWYELCDQYGLYLVAEANVECHGLMDRFNDEPLMKQAIIDRNVANVESFKNHPSVIIWSLGNECGTGGGNFRTALEIVKKLDETRPTHYEGFSRDKTNPADLDSKMYSPIIPYENPSWKQKLLSSVELIAADTSLKKPFYLCEFAHAMFNSMGSLKEYGDLFDKYPSILGGAIWEFQDQGIYNRRDPKHPILAYGGGFGEFPNDHYFIHKGVVNSEREAKPHYPEMKYVFQWISVKPVDLQKGLVSIRNKYQFVNLDRFDATWELSENGIKRDSGKIDISNIGPRSEKQVFLPYSESATNSASIYHIRISFKLKQDELWAKKGFELASEQLELLASTRVAAKKDLGGAAKGPKLIVEEKKDLISVNGSMFQVVFDKAKGTIIDLVSNNNKLLKEGGGPVLHLWRAPHQEDDIYADKGWNEYGLKELNWKKESLVVNKLPAGSVKVTVVLKGLGKKDFTVNHKVIYTITADGSIRVENEVNSTKPELVLARMGVRMLLDKRYEQFSYFGRGPMENYSDRKSGSEIGIYKSTVMQQFTPYEKPMECGNHEDVRWATLANNTGTTLKVLSDNSLLQVAALPYTDEQMAPVEYRIDLPESNTTALSIGYKTLGVGSNACGPKPMPQYTVTAAPASFSYILSLSVK